MQELTGGDYDGEYTEKLKPTRPAGPDSSAVHMSPDSPKHDEEGNSEMEYPCKNEVEIKGVPYPMTISGGGGYCGHGSGDGVVSEFLVLLFCSLSVTFRLPSP
ncbi:hypothetical protein [Citrobacter sp. R56]|uniref:hypothetical protein n=1 Tax=Citrobacter sp. R56 TaxID=1573676 RepID=UPI00193B4958|nr:hypothetical protein [Citrobacter sp. R56]QRG77528.1 hypothetical protein JM656_12900 [Citrobacter sp. R56]